MEFYIAYGSLGLAIIPLYYGSKANKEKKEIVWLAGISLIVVGISWICLILSTIKGHVILIPLGLMGIFSYWAGRGMPDIAERHDEPGAKSSVLALIPLVLFLRYFHSDGQLANKPSQIFLEKGYAVLIESRAPSGSWFNRDAVKFGSDEVVFIDKSLIFKSSAAFPYSKIEEIEIKDGQIWNCVRFTIKGKWLNKRKNIYFTSDASINDLMIIAEGLKKENIVVKENKSLLKSICSTFK